MTAQLKVVPIAPVRAPRAGLFDYESDHRAAIARIDWAAVHVRGDRRTPIQLPELRRWWRK